MKTTKAILCSLMTGAMMASCGGVGTTSNGSASNGSVLGSVLGSVSNGEAIGNILTSVIGLDKLTEKTIVGTWRYDGPGCAFTSDNALAKAGGEVAATRIEEELKVQYDKLGFTAANTQITFNDDKTFSAKLNGKSINGTYSLNEQTSELKLKSLLLSINGYAKRNGTGISVLFESKKLLTFLQTVAALSGSQTIETVGEISKNYDGVRLGFDMKR